MSSSLSSFTKSLDRPLYFTALFQLIFAGFCLLALLFDDRTLLGIPVWIKPFKFAISLAIYTLTLAYLVPFVQTRIARNIISYVTSFFAVIETLLIGLQAARGVKSHFNTELMLDNIIFQVMGAGAFTFTLLTVYLGLELLRKPPTAWTPSFRLAVQLGIWLTVVGCAVGGYMSGTGGHTVGAPDGGPGLPVLSWSTVFGDWRVAHFIGLHALQVFILAGWRSKTWRSAKLFLWGLALAYASLLAAVIWLTWNAKSLFAF
jgi:hypothetical protein